MDVPPSHPFSGEPEIQISKLSKPRRTADVVATLQHMQKMIGAKNFAVLRVRGHGLPSARRLCCTLNNWADQAERQGTALLGAYGEPMLSHLEASTLPMIWDGEAGRIAAAEELSPFMERLPSRRLPYSGVAFPVQHGSSGNGFVVFTGDFPELGSDTLLDLHMRANQVMVELLSADERKAQPTEALNEREIACLQMAGDGCISEAIAEKMGLSVHTVNAYLGTATTKLDAVNRIQAIAKAIRLGYIR